MIAGGLALEVRPVRRAWAAAAGETLVAVLIKLRPTGEAHAPPLPLDLVLAIDAGPAMAGDRGLELALAAARAAVDGARPADRLGVVAYGERAEVLVPLSPLGDGAAAQRALAVAAPAELGPKPDLQAGLVAAAAMLRAGRAPGRASRLLLVAGEAAAREAEAEREARVLAETGVGLSTLGVGQAWPAALMARMADAGRGELWHAPRAADLAALVGEEVAYARALAFGEATLRLKLAAGVRPRRVLRVFPGLAHWLAAQPSAREAEVRLGDLPGDRPTYVLLELVMGPQAPGTYRLAQVSAGWRAAGGAEAQGAAADVVVDVGEAAAPPDAEAAYYVDRVQGYALVERALAARLEVGAKGALPLLESARRIAAARRSRILAPLDKAIGALGKAGLLPEAQAKALLMEARQPE